MATGGGHRSGTCRALRGTVRDTIGAHNDRNVRAIENRSADALCVFGRKLAAAQDRDRLPDGVAAGISQQGDAADPEKQYPDAIPWPDGRTPRWSTERRARRDGENRGK